MKRIKFDNFTHWKGKLASRTGMGMELALLVLFVVFACSILLVSSALLGKSNLNDRRDDMITRFRLDQFAESAMAEDGIQENETYREVQTPEGLEITDAEGNVLLTVTLDGGKITGWVYH